MRMLVKTTFIEMSSKFIPATDGLPASRQKSGRKKTGHTAGLF
jgi:hypothetical protein